MSSFVVVYPLVEHCGDLVSLLFLVIPFRFFLILRTATASSTVLDSLCPFTGRPGSGPFFGGKTP